MRTFYPRSLTTQDAGIITVKSGDQLSGMDITVQKATTYKITGELHAPPYTGTAPPPARGRGGRGANADPNAPQRIQGFLGLEYRDPSVIDMRSTNLGGTVPAVGTFFLTSGADGFRATFEVRDVLPGEYYLVPRVNNAVPAGSGIFGINRIPVDIRDRDITGLAIELVPSQIVTGILTIDGHAPGNVTARVAIGAVGNPSPTYQGISARAVIANPDDGTFTIGNATQTRYRLETVAGLPPDLYVSDLRVGAVSVFDTGFEVGKEPLPPLQVSVRSGAGTVEGVVRDSSNKPVSNAMIVVVPPERATRESYVVQDGHVGCRWEIHGSRHRPGRLQGFRVRGSRGRRVLQLALPCEVRVPR